MRTLTFGSLFAGIGGFDLGFERAGLSCAWQVEIDAAARGVLAYQWPDVARFTDVRDCGAHNLAPVDILTFGFPCQDLSVAGNRAGLGGARSGLFYEATRIADELRPDLLVWENVPGLLSSGFGRDFLAVLTELERVGYCGAWSTFDAQWFGVAQRRQRVFGVFARRDLGARCCAEILSLAARMPGHFTPSGAARTDVARGVTASAGHHGRSSPRGDGSDNLISFALQSAATGERVANALASHHGRNSGEDTFVAATLGASFGRNRGLGQENEIGTLVCGAPDDNSGQAGHLIVGALQAHSKEHGHGMTTQQAAESGHIIPILEVGKRTNGDGYRDGDGIGTKNDPMYTLQAGAQHGIGSSFGVRRLTPRECERLQGFPDDWTACGVDGPQADSARYRQLGNAVCVSVSTWLGQRIVEALL